MAALSLLRGQSVAFALTFFCSFCIAQSFIDASSNTTSALAQSTETLTESFVSSSNIQSASTATQTISSAAISSTTDDGSFLASIASNDSTTAGAQTTDLPDLGTMNTSSTSSMVSPATFATASNFSVSTTTTSSSSSTSPQSAIGSFEPIGCVGPVAGETGLQLASKRVDMTINRCLSKCAKSSYAGLFDTLCYCGDTIMNPSTTFDIMAPGFCNVPCPGDKSERCGGRVRQVKRQSPTPDMFLTLYRTVADDQTEQNGDEVILDADQNDEGFPIAETTVITTVYTDICETGYTLKTATVTTAAGECGAESGAVTATPPAIPMTVVEKICTGCTGPEDTIPTTVTLTMPDISGPGSTVTAPLTPGVPPSNIESTFITEPTVHPLLETSHVVTPSVSTPTTSAGSNTTIRWVSLIYHTADGTDVTTASTSADRPVAMFTGAGTTMSSHGLSTWRLAVVTMLAVLMLMLM